jgi:transposase
MARADATGAAVLAFAAPHGPVAQIGLEGTGTYGRQLAQDLVARGNAVFEVPGASTARERARSRGRSREKTDATDALAIARVVLRDHEHLPRIGEEGVGLQCHLLTEHRQNLLQERGRLVNQLYAHIDGTGEELRPMFRSRNNRRHLRALATIALDGLAPIPQLRHSIIKQLAGLVLALDDAIASLTRQLEALAPRIAPHLLAIPGCAALTATKIIGEAGHADRFATAARFGAYAGAAPIETSSGVNTRHRLSRRGNRQLNCALHIIAVTQRRWHAIGQTFLAKKSDEGKTRKAALRSLKRQLANVVFRALKHDAALWPNALHTTDLT